MVTDGVLDLVVVGELNPYGKNPRLALYHLPRRASGNRLRQHLGLRDVTYARLPKRNLCYGEWSAKAAREAAEAILDATRVDGVVVMLGAKVKSAFGCDEVPFFASRNLASIRRNLVSLPHPSGRSRPWNDPAAPVLARQVLRIAAPYVPWGETDAAPPAPRDDHLRRVQRVFWGEESS